MPRIFAAVLLSTAAVVGACGGTADEATPTASPTAAVSDAPTPATENLTFDADLSHWSLAAVSPEGASTAWRAYAEGERYRGPETIAATPAVPLGALVGDIAALGRYPAEIAVFAAGALSINLVVDGAPVVHPICSAIPQQASVSIIGQGAATSQAAATPLSGTMFGLPAVGVSYTVPDSAETSVHHIFLCVAYNGRELLLRQRISERGAREAEIFAGDWTPLDAVWPSMVDATPALIAAE